VTGQHNKYQQQHQQIVSGHAEESLNITPNGFVGAALPMKWSLGLICYTEASTAADSAVLGA
jgi:hypothetical protein